MWKKGATAIPSIVLPDTRAALKFYKEVLLFLLKFEKKKIIYFSID